MIRGDGEDGRGTNEKDRLKRKRKSEEEQFDDDEYSSDEDYGNEIHEDVDPDESAEDRLDPAESFAAAELARRKQRLEKNRKKARDRRNRKKVMIEEMQRSVVVISRMNDDLRRKNQELTKKLAQYGRVGFIPGQPGPLLAGSMLSQQSASVEAAAIPADLYRIALGRHQQQIQIPYAAARVDPTIAHQRLLLGQGTVPVANSPIGALAGLPNNAAILSGLPTAPNNEAAALRYMSQQQQQGYYGAAGTTQSRLRQNPSPLMSNAGMAPAVLPQRVGSNTSSRPVHIVVHHHHSDPSPQEGSLPTASAGIQRTATEPRGGNAGTSAVFPISQTASTVGPNRQNDPRNIYVLPPDNPPGNSG